MSDSEDAATAKSDHDVADRREEPMSAEPGEVLTVTCGQVVARLHMERFICPGIHQECIEVENGIFVTPKVFAVMGEKEKLKDWKNAIRLNGKSIRKRMDAGELEFTKHNEICTGRCASRNLGGSKYDAKIESLKTSGVEFASDPSPILPVNRPTGSRSRRKSRRPSQSTSTSGDLASLRTLLTGPALNEPAFSALREAQGETTSSPARLYSNQPVFPSAIMVPADQEIKSEPTSQCADGAEQALTNGDCDFQKESTPQPNHRSRSGSPTMQALSHHSDEDSRETPVYPGRSLPRSSREVSPQVNGACLGPALVPIDFSFSSPASVAPVNTVVEINREMMEAIKFASDLPDADSLLEDSVSFWQSILDLGLLDNFFREIKRELDTLKHEFHCTNKANPKCAQQLSNIVTELGLMTKLKWRLAQAKTRTEREQEDLNNHIELLKRRVAESELKQRELKRKSETFDSLMDMGRAKRATTSTPNSCMSTGSSTDDRPT